MVNKNILKSLSKINAQMCWLLTTYFVVTYIKHLHILYSMWYANTRSARTRKHNNIILCSRRGMYKCNSIYWRAKVISISHVIRVTTHELTRIRFFSSKLKRDDRGHRTEVQDFQQSLMSYFNVCIIFIYLYYII
jgi:hypothetical protein